MRGFRDGGRRDAPTPGEIYREAAGIDHRAQDERRRRTLKLADQRKPSAEELERIKEMIRGIFEKPAVSDVQEAESPIVLAPAGPIDLETELAQAVILARRKGAQNGDRGRWLH